MTVPRVSAHSVLEKIRSCTTNHLGVYRLYINFINYLSFKTSDCLQLITGRFFSEREEGRTTNVWGGCEDERKNESVEYCSGILVVHHMNCGGGYETDKSLNVSVETESAICY